MTDNPLNRTKVKRGSGLPHSKLTEEDVILIRELINQRNELLAQSRSLSNAIIAEKFGVHCRTIDRISSGENWIHV